MAEGGSRISEHDFQIVIGILFAIAIIAAIIRTAIRLRLQKRLVVDDGFLIFACLSLTAATVIIYRGTTLIYVAEAIAETPGPLDVAGLSQDTDIDKLASSYRNIDYLHGTFSWLAVFSVKFSFLSFFYLLVDRLPQLLKYWRIVVATNFIAFFYCIIYAFLECPDGNFASLRCTGHSGVRKSNILVGIGIGLDIITDLLIISIPVRILWQVRIKLRQKLGIGTFLCLSLCMVVLACTRIGGFREDGGFDFTWHYFWLHVESSVAVFVVSLTAFRSLFVAEGPSANRRKARRWYSSNAVKKHLRPKPAIEDRDLEDCPTIPSASLSRVQMSARQGWLGLGSAENFSVPDRIMLQRREEELVNVIDDGYFGGLDNHSRTWNWV